MYVTSCRRPRSTSFAGLALTIFFVCAASRETGAQVAPCFPVEPTPPWIAGDLDAPGASRPLAGGGAGDYELCSSGGGFGGELDAYRYLAQAGDGDVTLTAIVDSSDPSGSAGLLARQDEREAGSAHVRIVVTAGAGGVGEIRSALRTLPGESATDGGTAPVSVALPVLLKIERRGTEITTHYDAGGGFVEHLSVDTAGSDLETHRLKYCLVQSSNAATESTARFRRASLASDEEPPPGIDCYPEDIVLAFEGEAEITLKGFALDGVRAVTVAGIDAAIVSQTPGEVTIRVPPRARGGASEESGDIVLESDHHKVVLPQSVVFAGRKYIRGDANSDGTLDLSDAVNILQFLFLGGEPLECPESGDVNDDDVGDLSDAVFLLQFLFLGGARIPPPHPEPGVDPEGDVCGYPPEPVWEGLTHEDGSPIGSEETLEEGDVVVLGLSGLGASSEAVEVLFGDTGAEVLEGSTPERLRLRIGRVPTAGRKCPLVFEKSGVETGLPAELAVDFTYTNLRGRPLDVDPDNVLPESCPTFGPSAGFDLVGSTRFVTASNGIFLEVDRRLWSSSQTHRVELRIFPPLRAGGSRGPRLLRFDHVDPPPVDFRGTPDGDEDYARWLSGLARRIRVELAGDPRATSGDDCGGGGCEDVSAEADPEGGGIGIGPCGGTATHVSPYPNGPGPDPGPPGPGTKLKAPKPPKSGGILLKANDQCEFVDSGQLSQRQSAWCRLAQVTAPHVYSGLPIWEHFAPVSAMFNPVGLNETKQPPERPLGEKRILFNLPAFIHFRFGVHYNIQCVPTQNFLGCQSGNSNWMMPFPRDALVVKTFWRPSSYLPASADLDDFYSYQPPGGERQYLVGMHLNSKDPPGNSESTTGSWLWATFFVPPPPADTLDKGGRPLSDLFHTACVAGHRNDIPQQVEGVWRNFVLCVDGDGTTNNRCGNPWGPKDECLKDTCNGCHTTRGQAQYPIAVVDSVHQFQWMSSLKPSYTTQTECYELLKPLIDAGEETPYSQFATPGCE